MQVIDKDLFERIRAEYVESDFETLLTKYGDKVVLRKILGSHSYEEFEAWVDE